MKKRSTNELTGLIQRLTVIRKQHVAALAEIESTFSQLGIGHLLKSSAAAGRGGAKRRAATTATAGKTTKGAKVPARRGRPPKAENAAKAGKAAGRGKKAGKRVRGKFEITGDELIVQFVRKLGCPTTEEIRRHWESEGRRGKAENNLTNLVKSGKLVRNREAGQTRSTYSLPTTSTSS